MSVLCHNASYVKEKLFQGCPNFMSFHGSTLIWEENGNGLEPQVCCYGRIINFILTLTQYKDYRGCKNAMLFIIKLCCFHPILPC